MGAGLSAELSAGLIRVLSLAPVARAQADADGAHGGAHDGASCASPLARKYGLLGDAHRGALGPGARDGAPLGSRRVGFVTVGVVVGAAAAGLGRVARRWRRSARDDAILQRRGARDNAILHRRGE